MILASTSPRRAQLLHNIGLTFTVVAPALNEPDPMAEDERRPAGYVERLARAKAAACPADLANGIIILAADTVVWYDGRILNKPRDAGEAARMLRTLRGQTHQVLTGIALRRGSEKIVEHEVTRVTFCDVSDRWIESYVATGEPMDKAGAYAAQGLGAVMIERIEGDFSNVVGLPLPRLARALSRIGAPVEAWWNRMDN